jgi:hypothetical protein
MSTKHTPGPWAAAPTDGGFAVYEDDGEGNGDHIQCIPGHPRGEANARLIAAAPELLSALRDMVQREAYLYPDSESNVILDAARAAIAKATGQGEG